MMLLLRNATLRLLFLAQALYWSCSLIGITLTALIGAQLAPLNSLATLPLALLVLGNLLAVQPLSLFMQRHGRRRGLMLGAASGVFGGLLCALGVQLGDFAWLCLGALPIGVYQASAMYYRFAALEAVGAAQRGRASAWVIGGGVLAALLAPSLALWARAALPTPFVGAYLAIAGLALLGLLITSRLPQGAAPRPPRAGLTSARELLGRPQVRAAMACTAAGHGLMILIMNATPLAMQFCGLPLARAADVIQWHLLGMFLPAFIAGPLVDRLGNRRVSLLGMVLLASSAAVALAGLSSTLFLLSSLLLGMGWNLMLVAGTHLLGEGHGEAERGQAQGLMEQGNSVMAALMSFSSGALITSLGWHAVNLLVWPVLLFALALFWPARRRQAANA
ncbi:Predicted arabinose efflux permease, MFS family [Pseudomonas panipatensis]|uniref:Predicted arabinose efflux permease, MFS family n=1 Tax=Pseudomonas panipatensis TaxID=428992 RepID=A0A1G8FE78_9PSED|nr:Predicted arabinose efflux permease, MFS family [Pseudomonas panipatensis]SMP54271.1 Predicted arabinose efflux permease, MFS family [Pseudomonas panipatensis]